MNDSNIFHQSAPCFSFLGQKLSEAITFPLVATKIDPGSDMAKLFAIVGDSNVRPHMSSLNCRANPNMANAVVKTCGRIEALSETLRSIRYDVSVIILACLTNFITSCDPVSTLISLRVEPVLREFRDIVLDYCSEFPER